MFLSDWSSVLSELELLEGYAVQLLRAQWQVVSFPMKGIGFL